jgi:hypothetical protein
MYVAKETKKHSRLLLFLLLQEQKTTEATFAFKKTTKENKTSKSGKQNLIELMKI